VPQAGLSRALELSEMLMLINQGVRVANRRKMNLRALRDPVAALFHLLRRPQASAPSSLHSSQTRS